jgi:hypothetical protein
LNAFHGWRRVLRLSGSRTAVVLAPRTISTWKCQIAVVRMKNARRASRAGIVENVSLTCSQARCRLDQKAWL